MSVPAQPDTDLATALSRWQARLEQRRDAITLLLHTSAEMRANLLNDPLNDMSALLQRREADCRRLAEVASLVPASEPMLLDAARRLQNRQDDLGSLARSTLSLHDACRTLADDVMACQSECETMLKAGIEATAKAIRESVQRRKLGAAYGPACKHSTPVFLDRQR